MSNKLDIANVLSVNPRVVDLVFRAEKTLIDQFKAIDEIGKINQASVLAAFKQERVSAIHFNPTTGYGYSDLGREKLSALFACIFKAEHALVSPHLLSGTHTLFLMLNALLDSGDLFLSVVGTPYDTLATAIGLTDDVKHHTLIDQGVKVNCVALTKDNMIDYDAMTKAIKQKQPNVVYIQRSRGYEYRKSVSIDEIKKITKIAKQHAPNAMIICDNCYGEFCETKEPLEVGVDILAGSLIKNPGGGIAPNGGYLAGKKKLINSVEALLTAPGIGMEIGSYAASYLPFFQGLFLAPKIVAESLKGATLTAKVMQDLGFSVLPKANDFRTDITQSIKFDTKDQLIKFIQGVQLGSPIDAHVLPVPWDMPGYKNPVIMAAGTFIQGASLELSADAPIKKPYIAYMQGGLTYEAHMFGLIHALDNMAFL